VPAIVERTNQEHSYDVPCVIALPVVAGSPAYIDWVIAETSEAQSAASAADRPAS
jgi:periplasmic divalent cation tolerance protein